MCLFSCNTFKVIPLPYCCRSKSFGRFGSVKWCCRKSRTESAILNSMHFARHRRWQGGSRAGRPCTVYRRNWTRYSSIQMGNIDKWRFWQSELWQRRQFKQNQSQPHYWWESGCCFPFSNIVLYADTVICLWFTVSLAWDFWIAAI